MRRSFLVLPLAVACSGALEKKEPQQHPTHTLLTSTTPQPPAATKLDTESPAEHADTQPQEGTEPFPPPQGMILIPPGRARIGPGEWEPKTHAYTPPSKDVSHHAFFIDRFEVRTEDYAACIESGECGKHHRNSRWCNASSERKIQRRGNHPINCTSFEDAQAYCASVGKRLPTELEWEIAARGRDGHAYPWGNESRREVAREFDNSCTGHATKPTGCAPWDRSPFGLMDTEGNALEWVASWPADTNLTGDLDPADAVLAGVRGGSWYLRQRRSGDLGTRHVLKFGDSELNGSWSGPNTWQAPDKAYGMYGPPGMRCAMDVHDDRG